MATSIPINFPATITSLPVAIEGWLFFAAQDATHGKQLWASDGTSLGTRRLTSGNDVRGGVNPLALTAVEKTLYFAANDGPALYGGHGSQLWWAFPESGGYTAGRITDLAGGLYPDDMAAAGDTLYFSGYSSTDGHQLYKSDGTPGGTTRVTSVAGPPGQIGCNPSSLTSYGGGLYFAASDALHGQQLWATDPATGATTMLTSANAAGGGIFPRHLTAAGSMLYFAGTDANKTQLWASGGTAATTGRLSGLNTAGTGLNPQFLTTAGGRLYFRGDDERGYHLWSLSEASDAIRLTPADDAGVAPTFLTASVGRLYFAADGPLGSQLWRSDGTPGGTGTMGVAARLPSHLTDVDGKLYFVAWTVDSGYQIWQSDGTDAGTTMNTNFGVQGVVPNNLVAMGGSLYFTAPGASLWECRPDTMPVAVSWAPDRPTAGRRDVP